MTTSHHTLLATTGASPQVVTETLYAIHHENQQWPDDIYLITTSFGKTKAVEGLLEQKHLQRLCDELGRPIPAFDAAHILVTPGADGTEVEDARSVADHEALANFIMEQVRDMTADSARTLHASLAGGRKTMTFYMGYAMSLFGRIQDTLSHVLISEGFEGLPEFWFPTTAKAHRQLDNRGQKLDAANAQVTLAFIPFIRHRQALPAVLLQNRANLDFAQLVKLINLGEKPEEIFLTLDLLDRSITVSDAQGYRHAEIRLGELELPFYAMVVRASKNEVPALIRPTKEEKNSTFLSDFFLDEMLRIWGLQADTSSIKKEEDKRKKKVDLLADCDRLNLKASTQTTLEKGITSTFFDQRINAIKKSFSQHLPKTISRWLEPAGVFVEDDEEGPIRLDQECVDNTNKGGGYGIFLSSDNVTIKDA